MPAKSNLTIQKKKPSHPHRPTKKKVQRVSFKDNGLMKEFLGHVTRAAYQVALKTGFRGSFIHFLEEVQEALSTVIHQDEKRDFLSH
jgi:aromatic ring-cleaving dioxygenase